MDSYEYEFNAIENDGDDLYILTNYKAPKYRLIRINTNKPEEANWVDVIPEKTDVLESAVMIGGKLVVNYMTDAHSKTELYSTDGVLDHEIQLPGIGTVSGFSGKKDDTLAFFSYTSFNTPGEIYKYDFTTNQTTLHFRPEVKFNPEDFEVSQVFYASAPFQYALSDYLDTEISFSDITEMYQGKRNYFNRLMIDSPFKIIPTQGTYFQLIDYSEISELNDLDFSYNLLMNAKVSSVPLSTFYKQKSNSKQLRICFAKTNETLEIAAERLTKIAGIFS
jgi:hypothetical protein